VRALLESGRFVPGNRERLVMGDRVGVLGVKEGVSGLGVSKTMYDDA
jgi:hypothetical protein